MNRKQAEEYAKAAIRNKLQASMNGLPETIPNTSMEPYTAFPKRLFKYASINDYTIESLTQGYIYLCPAMNLDDQFECRVDFPLEEMKGMEDGIVADAFVDYITDLIEDYPTTFTKRDLKKLIRSCLDKDRRMNMGKVTLRMQKERPYLSLEEQENVLKAFGALCTGAWLSGENEKTMQTLVTKAAKAKEEIGIGSLTENGKSQVMWEMYGNHYQGVCIEYDFRDDPNALLNIFPVIYGDKRGTNILRILVGMSMDGILNAFAKGKEPPLDNALAYIKLFLAKYAEWSFQKEWRVIGEAKGHFPVRIKAVYMGKKIAKADELAIITIAKAKGIRLYKQKDNYSTLALEYEEIGLA